MRSAKTDTLKKATKKVYEAVRYSDPVSNAALSSLDTQIERDFAAFAQAVKDEDDALADKCADSLAELLNTRNQKCKLLK